MKRLTLMAVLLSALVVVWAGLAVAEETKEAKEETKEEVKHDYVGVKKCKMCHKPQYSAWLETGHAKTDLLTDAEKKKTECISCHVTGTTAKDTLLLEGVQCEACHGPGSDYKSPKIKSKKKWKADRDAARKAAIEAGLIYPTEGDCKRCHKKEGNPNFKAFDFAKMKPLVHKVAVEEAKEKPPEKK